MLKPTRPLPRPGSRVAITHFGGEVELAAVSAVLQDGRRLLVSCEAGEAEFVLSEATAKFVESGATHGTRLQLLD